MCWTITHWLVVFNSLTVIVLGISAYYLRSQIIKEHEWNRRKETQYMIHQMHVGSLENVRTILNKYADFSNSDETYEDVIKNEIMNSQVQKVL